MAALFLEEPLNAVQLLGMAVVIGAVGLVVLRSERGSELDAEVLLEAEPPA